jgi:hypothetical protein
MSANVVDTRELSIETILRMAMRVAGLLNAQQGVTSQAYTQHVPDAINCLEVEMDALQAEGVMTRHVDLYLLPLVAGQTDPYTMPADTIDCIGTAMYIDAVNTNAGETPVQPILREAYQVLSAKSATGRPYLYYVDRQETVKVYLWPQPTVTGDHIRFQRHKLAGDNNDTSKTPDMERYWVKYLVYATAHHLMLMASRSPADCGYVFSRAEIFLKKAAGKSRQRPGTQMNLRHATGWERNR